MAKQLTGRLAPSPTGYMHLGNAWSFLLNWLALRSRNGRVLLRMDDIDPQRSRADFASAIIEDLLWLGLDWDSCGSSANTPEICFQSERLALYEAAIHHLECQNLVYPCFCTRRELRSLANAPHIGDMGAPYPGTCRCLSPERRASMLKKGKAACLRLRCPDIPVNFTDILQGTKSCLPGDFGGDFALKRSDGVIAYQLATVVDDAQLGVSLVVRGRDLLSSTPRQLLLFQLFGAEAPAFAHIPLLLDANGERMAKRHASLSIRSLRNRGYDASRIVGELACLAGLLSRPEPCMPADLLPFFSWDKLPVEDLECRRIA